MKTTTPAAPRRRHVTLDRVEPKSASAIHRSLSGTVRRALVRLPSVDFTGGAAACKRADAPFICG